MYTCNRLFSSILLLELVFQLAENFKKSLKKIEKIINITNLNNTMSNISNSNKRANCT